MTAAHEPRVPESTLHRAGEKLWRKLRDGALLYRLTNTDREGRYRVIQEIATDPHSSKDWGARALPRPKMHREAHVRFVDPHKRMNG
ncbi:MAG: hypothetical protein H0U43_02160 [Chthoniobacterales bacterium]|nr:hypothetical protein [Chthoniobacterales bacterium]